MSDLMFRVKVTKLEVNSQRDYTTNTDVEQHSCSFSVVRPKDEIASVPYSGYGYITFPVGYENLPKLGQIFTIQMEPAPAEELVEA